MSQLTETVNSFNRVTRVTQKYNNNFRVSVVSYTRGTYAHIVDGKNNKYISMSLDTFEEMINNSHELIVRGKMMMNTPIKRKVENGIHEVPFKKQRMSSSPLQIKPVSYARMFTGQPLQPLVTANQPQLSITSTQQPFKSSLFTSATPLTATPLTATPLTAKPLQPLKSSLFTSATPLTATPLTATPLTAKPLQPLKSSLFTSATPLTAKPHQLMVTAHQPQLSITCTQQETTPVLRSMLVNHPTEEKSVLPYRNIFEAVSPTNDYNDFEDFDEWM